MKRYCVEFAGRNLKNPLDTLGETALADDYEIWSVEGKPVSGYLRTSVAGQIRAMANATPEGRPEIETGGVLWGRYRQGAENYYIVSIEKADSLDCDHTRGEAWVLSDRDRRSQKTHDPAPRRPSGDRILAVAPALGSLSG